MDDQGARLVLAAKSLSVADHITRVLRRTNRPGVTDVTIR
jgi:hypothetical protein